MTGWPADARILVVDDEPANLRLLEQVLAHAGYRCVVLHGRPVDLLADAATQQPDLVLLDLHMPGLGGLELIRALRDVLPDDAYVPLLVVTADATRTTRDQALAAGAHDFLTKPFDFTEVTLRVGNLLATRGLHRRLAAQNTVLAEQVRDRTEDLEATRLELLHRLALAAESRDHDTFRHTVRVGRNAGRLADVLGLPPEDCVLLEHAAPLHDIGKIGIADAILRKPGPLTDEEFAQVKSHAEVGARILGGSTSEVLRMAERIALEHHERWDGSGYPRGLRAGEIALSARIVSVVDVFDALTHARPYKSAWPIQRAIEEMTGLRGRHFDPEVLDAFFAGVESGQYHDEELIS